MVAAEIPSPAAAPMAKEPRYHRGSSRLGRQRLDELGARPTLFDVGGDLGVDYDGSQTNFHSSKNYSVQEYANDLVSAIQEACENGGVEAPDIVTEAGRSKASATASATSPA